MEPLNTFFIAPKPTGMTTFRPVGIQLPPFLDRGWIPVEFRKNQYQRETFLQLYFYLALECDTPILEAFFLRKTTLEISTSMQRSLRKEISHKITLFFEVLSNSTNDWIVVPGWTHTARFKNVARITWTYFRNDPRDDEDEKEDIISLVVAAQLSGLEIYKSFSLTFRDTFVFIETFKIPGYIRPASSECLWKANVATQIEEQLMVLWKLCEGREMQEDLFYSQFGITDGIPNLAKRAYEYSIRKEGYVDNSFPVLLSRRVGKTSSMVSQVLPLLKICAVCFKLASFRCNRCKATRYCSENCQRKHWKTHKFICK